MVLSSEPGVMRPDWVTEANDGQNGLQGGRVPEFEKNADTTQVRSSKSRVGTRPGVHPRA